MRPLLFGLTALALVAGCSDDDRADRSAINPDGTSAVQIRPVLQVCMEISPGATVDTTATAAGAVPPTNNAFVPLADTDEWCQLGPSQADGTVFEGATARQDAVNGWVVDASLQSTTGQDAWNAIAAQCFQRADTCPTGQISIVVGGVAISVASVQAPEFQGTVQISGTFTETEAVELANLINAGAA